MQLVFFSKAFPRQTVEELIELAKRLGFEGYDLCCRPGFAINPDNVQQLLPQVIARMNAAGLAVPMVTGPWDLIDATRPDAELIFAAMQRAGVNLFKPGYFLIDNRKEDYWQKVDSVRRQLEGWSKLGQRFGVKPCIHTHSEPHYMGLNAAAVMHLVKDLDPETIGVYLDPGHLFLDGEHPDIAFNMVKKYLAIVALKDAAKNPNPIGEGWKYTFCRAGFGNVNWTAVFDNLRRLNFQGSLSVHGEYEHHYPATKDGERPAYVDSLREEFRFFKKKRDEASSKN